MKMQTLLPTPLRNITILAGVLACSFALSRGLPAGVRPAPESAFSSHAAPSGAPGRRDPGRAVKTDTTVVWERRVYDLARREDLEAFVQRVRDLRALSKAEKAAKKGEKQ